MSWEGEAAEAAWQMIGHGRSYPEGERRAGFNTGARWQREQLRTDEAVERAAESQWDRDDHDNMWNDTDHDAQCPDLRNDYRDDARAVINALIGETP